MSLRAEGETCMANHAESDSVKGSRGPQINLEDADSLFAPPHLQCVPHAETGRAYDETRAAHLSRLAVLPIHVQASLPEVQENEITILVIMANNVARIAGCLYTLPTDFVIMVTDAHTSLQTLVTTFTVLRSITSCSL